MLKKIEETDNFYNDIIETLNRGHIIALPTDTVYGFAVDATNKKAVEKLNVVKGRENKPYTYFVSRNNIGKYAQVVKTKVIDYFLPGPITVVLKKIEPAAAPEQIEDLPYAGEKLGFRIPQVNFILKLLSLFQKPLAVTSANRTGQPACNLPVEIIENFTAVKTVVDGGFLAGSPSTVIDLATTPPTLLRKGRIPVLEIEKVYGKRITFSEPLKFNVLFVCTGNSCRSPMAEGILKTFVNNKHAEVKSAGTAAMAGLPASPNAIQVASEFSVSLINHLTRPIDAELVDWADLVLTMEFKHYETILELAPNAAAKTFLLKEYKRKPKYNEIPDPVGKDLFAYHETVMEMIPSLKLVAKEIEKRFK